MCVVSDTTGMDSMVIGERDVVMRDLRGKMEGAEERWR